MERRIYTPVSYIEADVSNPVIFLAGPIQGAPNWQEETMEIISSQNPDIIIATPRREYLPGTFNYDEQVDWETYHLKRAGRNGAIMFWLPKEKEHFPDREYAQTSRFELAEWKGRKAKMVIGIEKGFPGEKYIRRRFSQDRPDVPILDNLEEACFTTLTLL